MAGGCGGMRIPSLPDKILEHVMPRCVVSPCTSVGWGYPSKVPQATLDLLCPRWFLILEVRQSSGLRWCGNQSLCCHQGWLWWDFKPLLSKIHLSLRIIKGHSECLQNSHPSMTVWYLWLQTDPKAALSRDLVALWSIPQAELPSTVSGLWEPFSSSTAVNACHTLTLQKRLISSAPLSWEFTACCEVARARYMMRCRQGEKCFSWCLQKRAKHLWEAGASGTPTFANCSWVSWR